MTHLPRIVLCVSALLVWEARGLGETADFEYDRTRVLPDFPTKAPIGFWEQFEHALNGRVDDVYADRLHPFKVMSWTLKRPDRSSEELLERCDRTVQSALTKSLEYSLRDAAVALPVVNWLESRAEALADLLVDSLDAVEEEAVSPTSPLSGPAERSWWNSLAEKRALRYGLRPFRADPYAFMSLRLNQSDQLLLLGHVRYYLQDFTDHRFELAVSVPLAHGFAMDVGTSYQFGRHEQQSRVVFRLFKPLKHGGMMHLGVEAKKDLTLFAGIAKSW